jgi:hypothetical protein
VGQRSIWSKTIRVNRKRFAKEKNDILSRSDVIIPGGIVFHSIEELLDLAGDVSACGGCSIYQLLLPGCLELSLSTTRGNYDDDAIFPEYESMFDNERRLFDGEQFYVTKFVNKSYQAKA